MSGWVHSVAHRPTHRLSLRCCLTVGAMIAACGQDAGAPQVLGVTPDSQQAGERLRVTIVGERIEPRTTRRLDRGEPFSLTDNIKVRFVSGAAGAERAFALSDTVRVDSATIAGFTSPDAPPGRYSVIIDAPSGASTAPLSGAFTIQPADGPDTETGTLGPGGDTGSQQDREADTDTETGLAEDAGVPPDSGTGTDADTESDTLADLPHCRDGVRNQGEVDIDCGGRCPECPPCALWNDFEPPEVITGLGLSGNVYSPALSKDGATMFFSVNQWGWEEIYTASREDRGADFDPAVSVVELNSFYSSIGTPYLSSDGHGLYYYTERYGSHDIVLSVRASDAAPFSPPALIGGVNSDAHDHKPWLTEDQLTLVFVSRRGGYFENDVWITHRASLAGPFVAPRLIEGISSPSSDETSAVLSRDGRTIFFSSDRPFGFGDQDLWRASRADPDGAFSGIENLSATINSAFTDWDLTLTNDERELFFASNRLGRSEIWRSVRTCQVAADEKRASLEGRR